MAYHAEDVLAAGKLTRVINYLLAEHQRALRTYQTPMSYVDAIYAAATVASSALHRVQIGGAA